MENHCPGPRENTATWGETRSSEEAAELQTGALNVTQVEALQALHDTVQSRGMAEKHMWSQELGNAPSWSCTALNCLFLLLQPAERVTTATCYNGISPAVSELAEMRVSSAPCPALVDWLAQGHPGAIPMGFGQGDRGLTAQ